MRGVALASELFSDYFPQDVLVERQVGHHALQSCVLITQLAQITQFGQAELVVPLLPKIKARLADAQLSAHFGGRRSALRLVQRVGDLLVGELLALHGPLSRHRRTSDVSLVHF